MWAICKETQTLFNPKKYLEFTLCPILLNNNIYSSKFIHTFE